ncbi:MAG: N-6 DNA methylase [Flavobacteriales bacterium]|nr:N-6 DNA methylase [Flavobacteriales bacterium]
MKIPDMPQKAIQAYIDTISDRFKRGTATEHSYRGDLQQLIETLVKDITATNEPKRIACGAPDYIITKKDIPVGYIEAKDIGVDLKSKTLKEQFDRYRTSLDNLIITDYLDFHLYLNGEFTTSVKIGEIQNGKIVPLSANFEAFERFISDFCLYIGQTIKSSKKLAEMMAGKARMLSDVIEKALIEDEAESNQSDTALQSQLHTFKEILIHDIKPKEFADIYAQTIAYGMFAARLHDTSLETFNRQEAANLIPKSNPFLRKLFQYIAGYDLDTRIVWIVDGLADLFRATDIAALLKNFGKSTQTNDPIIHFYETFLSEYDPKLRKARGVWYTPEPVVKFIVRAVDDILKTEFGLPQGIADSSKTKIKVLQQGKQVEKEVHKVQILDPATGTGTFLAEVVKHIYQKFENQQGIWNTYVENHLIPRLNGFELLMASYAMAHLKLDMLLTETGYKPTTNQRFRVYLTNSLEESHPDTGTLFANWLSAEANEANHIKRDTPVMCVIGNPPYSNNSTNKNEWILDLIKVYKENLNEKKINLDDDYIKFIRYGQHFIQKNGSGILAYISNNSFLSGVTHREMRKNLTNSFDKIYILDLHGNSNIKENQPDGSPDQNVFDIKQGVSINIFVKTKTKSKNCDVLHIDLYGNRNEKYQFLIEKNVAATKWTKLKPKAPYFFFTSDKFDDSDNYKQGFKVNELFEIFNSGIKTDRDNLFIDFDKSKLSNRIKKLISHDFDANFVKEFKVNDSGSYKLTKVIKGKQHSENHLKPIQYRPFDNRWIYYDPKIISRPASKAMKHLVFDNNLSLSLKRQSKFDFSYSFIHRSICESCLFESAYANNTEFPLYLYPETDGQQTIEQSTERQPNLNTEIVKQITAKLGLTFTNEKETDKGTFAPIDLLDYIYAVLHSPTYREKYKEFLKIDFPRVPYPKDKETFWKLVKLGGEIRQIHLLESPRVEQYITKYPISGDNEVTKPVYIENKVYINDTQYFDNVPPTAWNFYIGGYQPAQKWLKDRKGRVLDFEDILHYQKIIVALSETDRLMKEIDKINIE